MKTLSKILGIAGGVLGIFTVLILIDYNQHSLINSLLHNLPAIILSASAIICALMVNQKPKIAGMLMLIICSINFIIFFPFFIIPVPFLVLGGIAAFFPSKEKINIKLSDGYFKFFITTLAILLYSEMMYGILSYYFYYRTNPQDTLYWKPFLLIFTAAIIVYSLLYSFIFDKIYSFSAKYLVMYNCILGILTISSTMLSSEINNSLFFSLSDYLLLFLITQFFISILLKKIFLFSTRYLILYNTVLGIFLIILIILSNRINIYWFFPPFDFLLMSLIFQLFISLICKYKTLLAKMLR